MFGSTSQAGAAAIPGRSFVSWSAAAATLLALAWMVPPARAIDPPTDAAIAHLAELAAPKRLDPAVTAEARLYQAVYWMWVATRQDISPEGVLNLMAQRAPGACSESFKRQMLIDWHVASTYGLLTPENTVCLRDGTIPMATDGHFAGQRIKVVKIRDAGSPVDLANMAFCPENTPLPAEARVGAGCAPPTRVGPYVMPARVGFPSPVVDRSSWAKAPQLAMPPPQMPMPPLAATPQERVELHDVAFNDSLSLTGTRKLAVASVNSDEISVSIIGDGPKVWKPAYNEACGGDYYPTVHNTKVPRALPVHLPGVTGNAYLIHSENSARYYFVDTIVNNGGAFRIAKVTGNP